MGRGLPVDLPLGIDHEPPLPPSIAMVFCRPCSERLASGCFQVLELFLGPGVLARGQSIAMVRGISPAGHFIFYL